MVVGGGGIHRVGREDSIVRKEEPRTDCVCLQINSACSDVMSKCKGMVDNGIITIRNPRGPYEWIAVCP